ncbi:hypothetical protein [Streptomyces sp. NBC_00268]|uniref:MmyB family transcriptional regulator n=1 Tax=Streptomyces sp. NBC_00268 TaxID=2975695 RepID=UPI00225A2162|nr:hypothetical protein [Streptomyces sp. NBC_00268]MCX5190508.1 hypothetical protein [Streptomyces sp. NBC_00268]
MSLLERHPGKHRGHLDRQRPRGRFGRRRLSRRRRAPVGQGQAVQEDFGHVLGVAPHAGHPFEQGDLRGASEPQAAGRPTAFGGARGCRDRPVYADWECVAEAGVGALRVEAGRYFYDRELSNLFGELSTSSCWRAGPPRPRWRRQPRRTPGTSVPPQPVLWLPPSAGPRRGFDVCGCHWGFLPLPLTAETPTSLSCRCAAPT